MEASYSISQRGSEYRILLSPANKELLSDEIISLISDKEIDISELMIDRIQGDETTEQDILHDITGWVADIFASNPNLVIYYSCDDMMPIPSRNSSSKNSHLLVNEYRSKLFSHIFDTYIASHQVTGVTNTPIRLDNYQNGSGYSIFIHFIARDCHSDLIELLKNNIKEVSGK